MSADLPTLARKIWDAAHIEGEFTLRSGRTATEYFDKYQFEAVPEILNDVAELMAPLIPGDTEVLAGLEMGGIPVATMLAQKTGLPTAFVRKEAKQYGTARLSEGAEIAGKRVLIIEDVVTSGGQIVISTGDLRNLGAKIERALCVIDRGEGGREKLAEHGIELSPLLTRENFQFD